MSAPLAARPASTPLRVEGPPAQWLVQPGLTPYEQAVAFMEARVEAIAAGRAQELVWLVEHPPLYTAGTSARSADLIEARFPVFATGRGGQYTYHGPGQRVVYAMIDLNRRRRDLRAYVCALETWLITTLARFGVTGAAHEGRVGVWVARPEKPRGALGEPAEDKIAAIGVRVRRWVTFHGLALNVHPDLGHFGGIVPCGLSQSHLGVTSLAELGIAADMPDVDRVLRESFEPLFGPTENDPEKSAAFPDHDPLKNKDV